MADLAARLASGDPVTVLTLLMIGLSLAWIAYLIAQIKRGL